MFADTPRGEDEALLSIRFRAKIAISVMAEKAAFAYGSSSGATTAGSRPAVV
ncbi:hypothetical protein [Nocardia sp. NPDC050710]|uniref:hypothetical protein n=1 Tax=Nocardia sp. NPDC050710 TaxID=3157220 RepID=UPI0033F63701